MLAVSGLGRLYLADKDFACADPPKVSAPMCYAIGAERHEQFKKFQQALNAYAKTVGFSPLGVDGKIGGATAVAASRVAVAMVTANVGLINDRWWTVLYRLSTNPGHRVVTENIDDFLPILVDPAAKQRVLAGSSDAVIGPDKVPVVTMSPVQQVKSVAQPSAGATVETATTLPSSTGQDALAPQADEPRVDDAAETESSSSMLWYGLAGVAAIGLIGGAIYYARRDRDAPMMAPAGLGRMRMSRYGRRGGW
jgi:hypothetical protein